MQTISKETHYNLADICKVLKASKPTVKKAVQAGKIPHTVAPLTNRLWFEKATIHQLFTPTQTKS